MAGLLLGLATWACASSGAPPGSAPEARPSSPSLQDPHWDQVCRDDRHPVLFTRVREVADSTALAEALEAILPVPGGAEEAWIDLAVSLSDQGEVWSVHPLGHNLDPSRARRAADAAKPPVRRQVPLLQPVFLRLRASAGESVRIQLLPAEYCLPHIRHEPGEPPAFLEGATAQGGAFLPPGHDPERTVSVRLHISGTGELLEIEARHGATHLLERVEGVLAETEFDPALINRHATAGTLDMVFRFPPEASPGSRPRDPD